MTRQPYLVAYDIRDPKRLQRVHGYLKRRALPVQYSVFVVQLTTWQLRELLAGLARLVQSVDDVRIYALGNAPRVDVLGAQTGHGVTMTGVTPPGLE